MTDARAEEMSREIDDAVDLYKHLDKQYKFAIERGNREDADELFVKMRMVRNRIEELKEFHRTLVEERNGIVKQQQATARAVVREKIAVVVHKVFLVVGVVVLSLSVPVAILIIIGNISH
jgi:hypothetical protein